MTPFIMSDAIEKQLRCLRHLAERADRRLHLEVLIANSEGYDPEDPSTRRPSIVPVDQTIELPFGWKVSLSIERQPPGWCSHASISAPTQGKVPHPEVVKAVLPALGFQSDIGECMVFMEHYKSGRIAVNVLELIEGTPWWEEQGAVN